MTAAEMKARLDYCRQVSMAYDQDVKRYAENARKARSTRSAHYWNMACVRAADARDRFGKEVVQLSRALRGANRG